MGSVKATFGAFACYERRMGTRSIIVGWLYSRECAHERAALERRASSISNCALDVL